VTVASRQALPDVVQAFATAAGQPFRQDFQRRRDIDDDELRIKVARLVDNGARAVGDDDIPPFKQAIDLRWNAVEGTMCAPVKRETPLRCLAIETILVDGFVILADAGGPADDPPDEMNALIAAALRPRISDGLLKSLAG
jgi:hypothetical protein